MIPNFFEQQQQSLLSGMNIGNAIQKNRLNQEMSALRGAQEDRAQQAFETKEERSAFDFEQAKAAAARKNLLQDSVILASLDEEAQNKLLPALKRKYQSIEGMGDALSSMEKAPYEKRMENLYGFIDAMRDKPSADKQFGAQKTFKDSKGNLFFGTTERNPSGGGMKSILASVDGTDKKPVGKVELVSDLGQTSAEKAGTQIDVSGKSQAVKDAVKQGTEAFQQLPKVMSNISRLDDAIRIIDSGANTGPIQNMFPSFQQASVELQNLQNQLGLDVVGMTTFGALSKGELDLALNTALPTNLEPEALKQWVLAKKNAQQKVYNNLMEVAQALSGGNMTIADFLKSKKGDNKDVTEWSSL